MVQIVATELKKQRKREQKEERDRERELKNERQRELKEERQREREREHERQREYKAANPELILEQKREYRRQYRAANLVSIKAANLKWKADNADKIKEERLNNKPKYAAIQRAYDLKMRNDPHYIALSEARQKRYLENKKLHPENYKQ